MSRKQREALLAVYDCAKDGVLAIRESAFEKVMEALAEPIRNCDVGTAEEQEERFKNFCLLYNEPCNVDGECWNCPLFKAKAGCMITWSQMPYEEGESNGQHQK